MNNEAKVKAAPFNPPSIQFKSKTFDLLWLIGEIDLAIDGAQQAKQIISLNFFAAQSKEMEK